MEPEKQPLLENQQAYYPPQYGQPSPPNYSQQSPNYPQVIVQQPAPVIIKVEEPKSNLISFIMFLVGWIAPILWFIGSCVPTKSSFDRTWRMVNRVFSCLGIIALIVTLVLIFAVFKSSSSSSGLSSQFECGMSDNFGRCYECSNDYCSAYKIVDKGDYKFLSFSETHEWLDIGQIPFKSSTLCLDCRFDQPKCKTYAEHLERCYTVSKTGYYSLFEKEVIYSGNMTRSSKNSWINYGIMPRSSS